jgi:hypothetical protein
MQHIVREEFRHPQFNTPIQRHYAVTGTNAAEAVEKVRRLWPADRGIIYGCGAFPAVKFQ